MRHFVTQVGIWLTQTLNVWLLFGYADESVSSRCWRMRGYAGWAQLRYAVDFVAWHAFKQQSHCQAAYMAELDRRQYPPAFRD